jgi:ABC-type branched-subunit amino acid transport system permease subunit
MSGKWNGTTTSMPQALLFELKGARVTPHIATFGGTSYQIANIGSVHVARRKRLNPLAVLIFLLGLGILAAAIVKSRMTGLPDEYFSMAVTGVAVMLAALLLACTRFRGHRVRCFDGAGGGSWRDGSLPASSSLRLCA